MNEEPDYHVCIDDTGDPDERYAVWVCRYEGDPADEKNDHPGDMAFSFVVFTCKLRVHANNFVTAHFPLAPIRFVAEANRPNARTRHVADR